MCSVSHVPQLSIVHRVDRILSFLSSRPNWDSPLTRRRVCLPLWWGGRGTLACGRRGGGGGGGHNSNEGTVTVVFYVYIYVYSSSSLLCS